MCTVLFDPVDVVKKTRRAQARWYSVNPSGAENLHKADEVTGQNKEREGADEGREVARGFFTHHTCHHTESIVGDHFENTGCERTRE